MWGCLRLGAWQHHAECITKSKKNNHRKGLGLMLKITNL